MGRGKHDAALIEHRNKAVAAWVDRYIRENGMTKVQLAQMAGISPAVLTPSAMFGTGTRKGVGSIGMMAAMRLALVTGASLDEIVGMDELRAKIRESRARNAR
jgi:hypothetical protein